MTSAAFISSQDLWTRGFASSHPLKPMRLQRTHELLAEYGAWDAPASRLVPARPATREELLSFHTPEYVQAVETLSARADPTLAARHNFLSNETPAYRGMYESESLKVGSTLAAAELVAAGQVSAAFSFAGGMHHARPNRAGGFCVFNDAAIAIHWLAQQGLRVAYVDIDAHHGDGVQAAFYDTDQVLTISLHQAGILFYPGTGFPDEIGRGPGFGYSINVPFYLYTGDEIYQSAFRRVVPPLVRQFAPDVLVTQLGVDSHYRDPLTRLALTTRGYVELVKELNVLAGEVGRWLALGGGGYSVEVTPRAWTLAYGVMSGQQFPDELPTNYAQQYGAGSLCDDGQPEPQQESIMREVRAYAEKSVARLQALTPEIWKWEKV